MDTKLQADISKTWHKFNAIVTYEKNIFKLHDYCKTTPESFESLLAIIAAESLSRVGYIQTILVTYYGMHGDAVKLVRQLKKRYGDNVVLSEASPYTQHFISNDFIGISLL